MDGPHPSHEPAARPALPDVAPPDPGRYRLFPSVPLPSGAIGRGFAAVARELAPTLARGGTVLLDGEVGAFGEAFRAALSRELESLGVTSTWTDVHTCMRGEHEIDAMLAPYLGDHPVFGHLYPGTLRDLFDPEALAGAADVARAGGAIACGPGAALLAEGIGADGPETMLAYTEVPKSEAQARARAGVVSNLGKGRPEAPKEMYKRSYFVDWPVMNRHKAALLPTLDLLIDTQRPSRPTCVRGPALRDALGQLARRPFRPRPYFQPGAWGGHALQRLVPELPSDVPNYAWSFELIAPENGILLEDDGALLEVPFDTLMAQESARMLGAHVQRFGERFPIRFDFLDTMGGGNLSLQVHPSPRYIRERFGEPFTQDETYYLLDTADGSEVYLGFREDVDPAVLRAELEGSAREGREVDVRRHVQAHPAARHDLFLIPHGTIHCSGAGNLVLEISATPYIYTFKLYDWLRLDLDGTPRPLDLEHGFANLDFSRKGRRVQQQLMSRPATIAEDRAGRVEHLPTHAEHFYDVHRLVVHDALEVDTDGSCQLLSLVDGAHMELEVGGASYRFHYAETVVMPAAVERYRVRNPGGGTIRVVKAFLKPSGRARTRS